jgi:hypothetical protein
MIKGTVFYCYLVVLASHLQPGFLAYNGLGGGSYALKGERWRRYITAIACCSSLGAYHTENTSRVKDPLAKVPASRFLMRSG